LEPFRHIALMYAGLDDFVRQNAAFLREGIEADEPALVMVGPHKIAALREELGADAGAVHFIDMTNAGRNPAWIIPAWNEFAGQHAGRPARGIGEPIWAERSPTELVECQRHESLLNYAFANAAGFTLLCPYDTEALDEEVIEEARASHPCLAHHGTEWDSESYRGVRESAAPFTEPLPEPETVVRGLPFNADMIETVRRSVASHAEREGLPPLRRDDLILAVNEIASNSGGLRGARPRRDRRAAGGPRAAGARPARRLRAVARPPGLRPGPGAHVPRRGSRAAARAPGLAAR
jgi:hypothetical protein